MTNSQSTSEPVQVTQADEKRAKDWASMLGRMGGVVLDPSQVRGLAAQFAAHRAASNGERAATPMRENDKPPAHWTADDKCDRHPQTVEEWDWRADKPDATEFSIKRLNFAVDRGDPHAPDQMAIVLRVDLSRVLGRLTHYTAHREMLMAKNAAASPMRESITASSVGADDLYRAQEIFESIGIMASGCASAHGDPGGGLEMIAGYAEDGFRLLADRLAALHNWEHLK